jgi:EAL domain-containing protein (putative c-di-GMP-specific phosphodiesterase class I)
MYISLPQIRRGLALGEFEFHYQPKVAFATGKVSGSEALIRWRRDDGALLPPRRFIPLAESGGVISQITTTMFPRLIEDFRRIRAEDRSCTIAFNVSAHDLDAPELFVLVHRAIHRSGIDAASLELEITEGMLVSRSHSLLERLARLMATGVRLSMDDYGTGFSSLATLNRLPFSAIKMDQSFVAKVVDCPKSATLVNASLVMAQLLGIKTVVEGIESEDVYHALLHSGCTEGQGYWICPPLPLEEFLCFLRSARRWPASPVGLLRAAQISHTWQHKMLVDTVFAALRRDRRDMEEIASLHLDHTECALGQWYYGPGQEYADDPNFVALEEPHRIMHEICEHIVQALRAGADRDRLRELLRSLTGYSCTVFTHLQQLEARAFLAELD